MRKLVIIMLLALTNLVWAVDYGTPYTGYTPMSSYSSPVQSTVSTPYAGYSTVATGGMTTYGEGGAYLSGPRMAPTSAGTYIGQTIVDGGKTYVWNGSSWELDDDDEETSKGEPDIVPVGDGVLPLLLMSLVACTVIYMRRRKQQAEV